MCSLNGMAESHHWSLISSSIWCSCNRIIVTTADYSLRGFSIHPFSSLVPCLGRRVCFPHFTDNRNEPQSDWTEAQVVNCPGELSRLVAGSRRLRVYPTPHREVETDSGPLLTHLLVFRWKEAASSALSVEIMFSHKIRRHGNGSLISPPRTPQSLGRKAGFQILF